MLKNQPVSQVHALEKFRQWYVDNSSVVAPTSDRHKASIAVTIAVWHTAEQLYIRTRVNVNNGTFIRIRHCDFLVLIILCFSLKMRHHKLARMNGLAFARSMCARMTLAQAQTRRWWRWRWRTVRARQPAVPQQLLLMRYTLGHCDFCFRWECYSGSGQPESKCLYWWIWQRIEYISDISTDNK